MKMFFLLVGVLVFHATPARAELCRLFHASLESGKPVHEILPDAVQLFAHVANEQNAIPAELRARFLEDPFSFPAHDIEGIEFRDTLLELQKAFREAPDQESIRTRTRERLASSRTATVFHEVASKTEHTQRAPVSFFAREPKGELVGNGDFTIEFPGNLIHAATGKPVDDSKLGLGNHPRWTPLLGTGSRFLAVKGSGSWDVYLTTLSDMTKIKLSKSPFPSMFFKRLFPFETIPEDLKGNLSTDGSTLLVMASAQVKEHGRHHSGNGVRASLYDARTGEFLAAIPPFEKPKNWDGRTWTGYVNEPSATLSSDGKTVWFSWPSGALAVWRLGQTKRSPFAEGETLDAKDHRLKRLVSSPDGKTLYRLRPTFTDERILETFDSQTGLRTRPDTEKLDRAEISPDGKWLATISLSPTPGRDRKLVIREASASPDAPAHEVVLPKDTYFEGFTPDGTRLRFGGQSIRSARQVTEWEWTAFYSLEDWLKPIERPMVSPTAWQEKP